MTVTAQRLDLVLVERGLAASRERAQALVAAGMVEVDGRQARSAAQRVGEAAELRMRGGGEPMGEPGRGEAGWPPSTPSVSTAATGSASTPGPRPEVSPTCSSPGARRGSTPSTSVHGPAPAPGLAGDPGSGPRPDQPPLPGERYPGEAPSLVTLDLSFISLRLVLPAVARLAPGAEVVALFKPQFELGRDAVPGAGSSGTRRPAEAGGRGLPEVVRECSSGAAGPAGPILAPIRGTRGNQELLVRFRLAGAPAVGRGMEP